MNSLQLTAYKTLAKKEIIRIFRIWTQTLLPSTITISLYFVIFGSFIGNRLGDFMSVPYMTFIIPGLIMLAIITNSFSNVASAFFTAKFQRSLEEVLVSPVKPWIIVAGYVSGGVVRGACVSILVTIISLLFVPLKIYNIPLLVATTFLTALLFSLMGLFNGIFSQRFDHVSLMPTFVLTPLTYLGGVFYSIDVLPRVWQTVSLFNPVLYLVNLMRFSFLGISDISIIYSFFILFSCVTVMFMLCVYMIQKGIRIKS